MRMSLVVVLLMAALGSAFAADDEKIDRSKLDVAAETQKLDGFIKGLTLSLATLATHRNERCDIKVRKNH